MLLSYFWSYHDMSISVPFDDPLTEWILVEDTRWLVSFCRWTTFILSLLTAALLGKLYYKHEFDNVNNYMAIGSVGVYFTIAWFQPGQILIGSSNLIPLTVIALIFVLISFIGAVKVMKFNFFKKRSRRK